MKAQSGGMPEDPICGARHSSEHVQCQLLPGHEGDHEAVIYLRWRRLDDDLCAGVKERDGKGKRP